MQRVFTQAPALETERLRMRPHTLDDFNACAGMWADPWVTRYIGGRPFSQEESWARLLRYAGLWPLLGYGYWAVEEKSTGAFIGEVGFADFKRDIEPPIWGIPEVGWALAASVHGHGYGTESVRAAVEWADANLLAENTVCLVHPENGASLRVAEKNGYTRYQVALYKSHPVVMLSRPSASSRVPAS